MSEKITVMISQEEVEKRIKELAEQINRDYEGKELLLVCILKGSIFFTCELAKHITVPIQIEFMRVSSYGNKTVSSGEVKVVQDLEQSIMGKHVLVVEDIVDTGRTLSYLLKNLRNREPASIRLTTLLDKPDRRIAQVYVDYTGFNIPDEFVVGYGLDYAQQYRNLPYIGVYHPDADEE